MPYAIVLRLDDATAARVEAMWRALARAGVDSDMLDLRYPAHVTLAIHDEAAPHTLLSAAVDRMARDWRALPVDFAGFGIFPADRVAGERGRGSVLYLAPVVTPALLARQAAVRSALAMLPCHPHCLPGAWVPHVTLSTTLPAMDAALAAVQPLWRPMTGFLNRLDLVHYRPVTVLRSHALPPVSA